MILKQHRMPRRIVDAFVARVDASSVRAFSRAFGAILCWEAWRLPRLWLAS
jgi:hypothetical protein